MNRPTIRAIATAALLVLPVNGCSSIARSPSAAITPDLASLTRQPPRADGRQVTALVDGARRGVHITAASGEPSFWLDGVEFTTGTIELDVRGKDVLQQSFVGVAFSGANDSTFEAVYLRPFNFRPDDPARALRAVQYISMPTYPWPKLRAERPNVFEKPVVPAPDPNDWVRLRVVVGESRVEVFVSPGDQADLVVERLGESRGRRVGLWVGNTSDGNFANMRITPSR